MKMLWEYLCDRVKIICCLFLMEAIAFFALWLQGTEFFKVSYAVMLSVFVLFIISVFDYFHYKKKRNKLAILKKCISHNMEELPDTGNNLEQDYQEVLKTLFEAKAEVQSTASIARQDMLDYYSLWAHQIKTPISAMRLLLQAQKDGLIAGNVPTEEMSTWNAGLSLQLFRIEQYVEMVLSYLRMEDIEKDLVLRSCDMEKLVNQAVKKFSKDFHYRKVSLVKDPIQMTVLTDEKWTLLVLEQILSNALKYTREGGCVHISQVDGRKELIIADTGIGIRAEDLPRVFEKGFTGYNGREDKKSTGIGLYLCKNIMEKLGQGIFMESSEGQGTKVHLSFERAQFTIE